MQPIPRHVSNNQMERSIGFFLLAVFNPLFFASCSARLSNSDHPAGSEQEKPTLSMMSLISGNNSDVETKILRPLSRSKGFGSSISRHLNPIAAFSIFL